MGVGTGGALAEHLALCDLTDEHHVAAQVLFVYHLAGEHGVGVLGQVVKAVVAALDSREILKLVDFPASLHTEMLDGIKADILTEYADVEHTGFLDDFFGQVFRLAGDGEAGGIVRHLYGSVDDAAVVLVFLRGQHEEAVAQVPCGRGVNRRFFLLSESNAPADPSEPCHDGPHLTFVHTQVPSCKE